MKCHLKSFAAPKSWTLLRKVNKFTTKPLPGAHPLSRSQPVSLLLKQLGFAKTTKEARRIVQEGFVVVDGRTVKDHKYCIGFMDSVHIKPDTYLRGIIDLKGKLAFVPTDSRDSGRRICRVIGKTVVPKGRIQLSLLGSRCILVERGQFKIGDSVVLDVPGQKIVERLEFGKDALVFLLGGRHIGQVGRIVSVDGNKIRCKTDNEEFDTLKELTFVIGKDKPVVKI